jgi:hypothetical protein
MSAEASQLRSVIFARRTALHSVQKRTRLPAGLDDGDEGSEENDVSVEGWGNGKMLVLVLLFQL